MNPNQRRFLAAFKEKKKAGSYATNAATRPTFLMILSNILLDVPQYSAVNRLALSEDLPDLKKYLKLF